MSGLRKRMYSMGGGSPAPTSPLLTGLKGYWTLNNTLADSLGVNPLLPVYPNYSFVGDAITFPGTNPQGVATEATIDIPFGSATRTVVGWMKGWAATSIMPVFGYGADAYGQNFMVSILGNKVFLWGSTVNHTGTITLNPAVDNLVRVDYDGTTLRIFVNEVFDSSATLALNTLTSSFRVGFENPYNPFNGLAKKVGIWDRLLTNDEGAILLTGATYPFI